MGKQRKGVRLYFLGSKITADGDCSHEIKRRFLLGRKVMTNLGRMLKSRDITSPKKVHLVKATVFPVVMYGCESWTVQESEWTPGVGDGQGGLACCDSWGRKESDTTERLNWTDDKPQLILHPMVKSWALFLQRQGCAFLNTILFNKVL